MALDRLQLRHQANVARYQAGLLKPPTRKQAKAWLAPIRQAVKEMPTGEVDSYRGYAVTKIRYTGNSLARIDECINGFLAMLEKSMPDLDTKPMRKVSSKLTNGVLLTARELDECMTLLNVAEDRFCKIPRRELVDTANTLMIRIELEMLGLVKD